MWSFGENSFGQLGTGNITNYTVPQKITNIPPVQSISCGGYHTLFITNDENLWSMGRNDTGQLCLNSAVSQIKPTQTSFSKISKIYAGGYHSIFQTNKMKIFGCGNNQHAQLGFCSKYKYHVRHSNKVHSIPVRDIIQISCGYYSSFLLNMDGKVFSAGDNSSGTLGLGGTFDVNKFTEIPNIPPIQAISCTGSFCYLLAFDGNVWSFGNNKSGQLGHGDEDNKTVPTKINSLNNIKQLSNNSCGNHFLFKDNENKIYTVGANLYGQLGTKDFKTCTIPIELLQKGSNDEQIWGDQHITTSRAKSARK